LLSNCDEVRSLHVTLLEAKAHCEAMENSSVRREYRAPIRNAVPTVPNDISKSFLYG